MTAGAHVAPGLATAGHGGASKGWIHSPAYDICLFVLGPVIGPAVVLANWYIPGGYRLGIATVFLIAIPHYLSSLTFFLGDDNLEYYKTRRAAFFMGPVVILGLVLALRMSGFHDTVNSVIFVWNVYHVSLQSAGILALYRRLNGAPVTERRVAHLAILAINSTMAFWFVDRFEPLFRLLLQVHPLLPWGIRAVALPVAASAFGILVYRMSRRTQGISLAEGSFFVSSVLLFHPYLWVRDSNLATLGMLTGHFIQYLAIVWLLHYRKYSKASGSPRQRALAWVSARPAAIFGALAVVGVVFYTAETAAAWVGAEMVYIIIWNSMVLVHFYLDGLIWAFRQPFVRQSIGPYLTPPTRRRE